jgi:hypothetical protein
MYHEWGEKRNVYMCIYAGREEGQGVSRWIIGWILEKWDGVM